MKSKRIAITCLCVIVLSSILSSCALPRRKPVQIASFNQTLPAVSRESLVIKFEESVSGKPLNQTVWDNISGPFWDVTESKQIGFTQHYKAQFFAVPPPLLPAVAQSGVDLIDTQIVIPFGNIFSSIIESAAQKTFQPVLFCYDEDCLRGASIPAVLKLKIEKFFVWEAPLNHLNLYVKGKSSYWRSGTIVKDYEFERSMLSQRLGSVLSTHSAFMDEMNRVSNQFAGDLAAEVFSKGL
jgi:hypothetical protein